MSLFFIRIKSITNERLIADGWRSGMFVCSAESAYGPTLEIQQDEFTGHSSRETANQLARRFHIRCVGVTFEVVEYKPSL